MKKIIVSIFLILSISIGSVYSYSEKEVEAANFLAYKGVITTKDMKSEYNLASNITRREMLKVMMNLSSVNVVQKCEGEFSDLSESDWGCKYAETALLNNMIADNDSFRPDDKVSKIEALKMIFKAINLEREENSNWQEGYINTALEKGIIENTFTDYGSVAERGWIFVIAKDAILSESDEDLDILDFFLK